MVDALVGSLVAVAATTAMLLAVQVTNTAFLEAGRFPLLLEEIDLLENAGYNAELGAREREIISGFLEDLPSQ